MMIQVVKHGRTIPAIDVSIDGQGFYQLTAGTAAGRQFMKRVEGSFDGLAYCDDTRMARDIADGAFELGLHVTVNGVAYQGQG